MRKSHEILNTRWNEMRFESWDAFESDDIDNRDVEMKINVMNDSRKEQLACAEQRVDGDA